MQLSPEDRAWVKHHMDLAQPRYESTPPPVPKRPTRLRTWVACFMSACLLLPLPLLFVIWIAAGGGAYGSSAVSLGELLLMDVKVTLGLSVLLATAMSLPKP